MKRLILTGLIVSATLAMTTPVWAAPTMTDVIVPQHIQGLNGTNTRRVPYAFRVKFTGMTPNATYRFINQFVLPTDGTAVNGAGNVIYVNTAGNFYRAFSHSFTNSAQHGEFTTDSTGEAEVWMITEPNANTRLTPGNTVLMRVRVNDGAGGTDAVYYFTSANGALVQDLTTAASGYTGIRGTVAGSPKDFVFLYDNEAGTGRPLSGTLIEDDGCTLDTTLYAAYYVNNVDGQNNNWGSLTPNNNANGVRRVERRSLLTGAIVAYNSDADGVWPSGADTISPSGGETPIVLTSTDAPVPEPGAIVLGGLLLAAVRRR